MKKPCAYLLPVITLLLSTPAADAKKAAHELTFDAQTRQLCQWNPDGTLVTCDPSLYETYATGNAIALKVNKASCTAAFRWQVDEREVAEIAPGFRGLGDVEGMLAGILAPPEAKGVVPVESATIREQTVEELLARMHTLAGVEELKQELIDEARALHRAVEALERDEREYLDLICPIQSVSACASGRNELGGLQQKLGSVHTRIRTNHTNPQADCDDFYDHAQEVRSLLAEIQNIRRRIQSSSVIASYPDRLVGIADALQNRLDAFKAKLRRAETAAAIALQVLNETAPRGNSWEPSESFLQHLRRLRETYQLEDVSAGVLQQLAKDYAQVTLRTVNARPPRPRLGMHLEDLRTEISKIRQDPNRLDLDETQAELLRLTRSVARADEEFARQVKALHDILKSTIEALVVLDRNLQRPRASGSMGPWSANQIVTVTVFEKEGFEMPDFSSLEQIRLPAGALATQGEEAPAPEEGFVEMASGTFEVHKKYRFNVGIGVAGSGIGEREFGVRQVPRLDDGDPVLDDMGDPIVDPVVFETGRDDEDLEFPLLITYYFKPLDSFPGEAALEPHWGISLGFGLDEPDENLFLGVSYQATLGIQLVGGVHYGRRTTLQDGIEEGDVLPAGTTEAPTRREWEAGPFFSVTFDANVFRRLLKGAS